MSEKMTRCPDGHFYDASKHAACPWCALPQDASGAEKTRPAMPPPLPQSPSAQAPATIRYSFGRKDPVVGWLVCIEGPDKGKDFRLHGEKNFLGRAAHMDVVIESDPTVSRDKHGIVVFDPKKNTFWILPGEASGLVYLNGEIVNAPSPMKADDVIELGQTKLVLIPFCGEKYNWAES